MGFKKSKEELEPRSPNSGGVLGMQSWDHFCKELNEATRFEHAKRRITNERSNVRIRSNGVRMSIQNRNSRSLQSSDTDRHPHSHRTHTQRQLKQQCTMSRFSRLKEHDLILKKGDAGTRVVLEAKQKNKVNSVCSVSVCVSEREREERETCVLREKM